MSITATTNAPEVCKRLADRLVAAAKRALGTEVGRRVEAGRAGWPVASGASRNALDVIPTEGATSARFEVVGTNYTPFINDGDTVRQLIEEPLRDPAIGEAARRAMVEASR